MKTEPPNGISPSYNSTMHVNNTPQNSYSTTPALDGHHNNFYDQNSNMSTRNTLNQPYSSPHTSRDLPPPPQYPHDNQAGFGPALGIYGQLHSYAYPHQGPLPFASSMGALNTPQYSTSGPTESFERTQIVPQQTANPNQLQFTPMYTPAVSSPAHNEAKQTKQSANTEQRRNTAPALAMVIPQPSARILFRDLPLRNQVNPVSINQAMYGIPGVSGLLSSSDQKHLDFLKQEMVSSEDAEDNEGMKDTWDKIVRTKGDKVDKACVLMLALHDHTIVKGGPLTEKKSKTHYLDPMDRFKALGHTLRASRPSSLCCTADWYLHQTQKTICKHIVEDPYVMQVIDDPVGATQRVANNRRVNDQKAKAINIGRENMGLIGKGKGTPLERVAHLDESPHIVSKYSTDGADSASDRVPAKTKRQQPRRKAATKRQYKGVDDEDGDYNDDGGKIHCSPPKRSRHTKTANGLPYNTQPPLRLETNVAPVSDSSNDLSSMSTPQETINGMSTLNTPSHHHSFSDNSFFAPHLAQDVSSPILVPPAMRSGNWGPQSYTNYNSYEHYGYSEPSNRLVMHGDYSDGLPIMPSIETGTDCEPAFNLDDDDVHHATTGQYE